MKKLLTVLVSTFLIASACNTNTAQQEDNLAVTTTIAPLYSLTAHLVEGTDTEVTNIVPPNSSVHSYTLTPETAKQIHESDIIVINGLELEEFIEDTLEDTNALIVETSEGVAAKKYEEEHEDEHEDDHHEDEHDDHHEDEHDEHDDHHEDEHDDHHGHHHGEYDPHIWLSPSNAKIQAANIAKALIELDQENAATYQDNLDKLNTKLDALNTEIKNEFAKLEAKPYIVFHDAYHYFEENFGVHAIAYLEEFPGKEPTTEYLTNIIDIINDNDVKVMFTEPQFSPKLVQTLSNDYNLIVGELDPLGQSISKDTYFTLIRGNFESFKKAFSQ